ncbi:TolC family protein [Bryobacter aggregatus]|uniref:TolC family protein n=1 Tax=Bryobacter aggregatus TaxID=360054 RepID=UPI00138DE539|nr:TolC family protein [Bryobacter aggregatus]
MRSHLFLFLLAVVLSFVLQAQTRTEFTLNDALREALDKNLDLIATRFDVPVARAQVITAGLRPNPVLSLSGDHLNLLPPRYSLENQAGPSEYAARTDFLFERGGKRQLRVEVAVAAQSVTEFLVLDAVRQLTFSVQNAFVEVLQAKADLGLAREIFSAFEEIVRINQSRLKSGDLSEVEVIRSQVAMLQFENTVRQAELQVKTTEAQLQILLGRQKMDPKIETAGEMRRDTVALPLDALREKAVTQRPDLLALQRDRIRTQADIRLQLAQAKLDYTLGSEYRRQQGLAGRGNSLGFFVSTGLPVFNRNQGEIERAKQQQMQTEARLRATQATIENEVEVALLKYASALRTIERFESTLIGKVKDVRQITEYSYKRGEASFLELLDTQRAYSETMQAYNAARADLAESLYGVEASVASQLNPEKK